MIEIPSTVVGIQEHLYMLEEKMKPLGYSIGGNWDYDHGFFDYKIDDQDGYQFLRVPFTAIDGTLDAHGVMVELGTPFVLSHSYQGGIDEEGAIGNLSASFDQFQTPKNPDAKVDERYVSIAKRLVRRLEQTLGKQRDGQGES